MDTFKEEILNIEAKLEESLREPLLLAKKIHATEDKRSKFYGLRHPLNVLKILTETGFTDHVWSTAAILHDVMEESSLKYEDLTRRFNKESVELCFCITNEKGKTREERNLKTWAKLKRNSNAVILKVADYIDNIEFAKEKRLDRLALYIEEYESFKRKFRRIPYNCSGAKVLWDRLDDEIQPFMRHL